MKELIMKENIRSITFKTFAKLMYYPDLELSRFLFDGVISEHLNTIGIDTGKLDSYLNNFNDSDTLLENLQVEYTHLFITAFPKVPAPIFRAFYSDKELFGKSTLAIMDIYQQYNFHVDKTMKEPPDHLAIELEFVYRLIENNEAISEQLDFIKNEILIWIDDFRAKVEEAAQEPIYPFLINVITNYLKKDQSLNENKLAEARL